MRHLESSFLTSTCKEVDLMYKNHKWVVIVFECLLWPIFSLSFISWVFTLFYWNLGVDIMNDLLPQNC